MPNLGTRSNSVAHVKSSISRTTVLQYLSFVVLMGGYFFSSCNCLPVQTENSNNEPWWCQPCKDGHKTRHSRGINEPLKTQFKIAVGNYDNEVSKYVQHIYTKITHDVSKKQFRKNDWLPRKKFFQKLRKDNYEILPELHKNIQIYAVTFQRLLDMEIRTLDSSLDKAFRTKTLNVVKVNINSLRCEVEQEIAERQLPAPERIEADFVDTHIPAAVDHVVDGLTRDYSILMDYANFIKKCFNKLFKVKKPKKNQKGKKGDKKKNNKSKRTTKNGIKHKSGQS